MEPKISATVLVIFVLLGVSANTAIYAQPTIITPHSSSTGRTDFKPNQRNDRS